MEVKEVINKIIDRTFDVLKSVYANQKEGKDNPKGSNGSRLIFPHYSLFWQ